MNRSRDQLLAELPRLEAELAAQPHDSEVRDRFSTTLAELTVLMRSATRDLRPVITTAKQREFCAVAADRIIALGGGGAEVQLRARALKAEIETGGEWVWQNRPAVLVIAAAVVGAGLAVAVVGGLGGSVAAVVAASLVSTAALAGLVLHQRRLRWQVDAARASTAIARHGV